MHIRTIQDWSMKLESKLKVYEKNIQFKRGNKFLYIDTHTYFRKKIQNVHRNIILGIVMNTLEAKKRRARKYTGQTQTIYFLK